jgi:hypothetical protein
VKPACSRSYEVEALRDGRLTGAARENFERHLGICRECTREAEALHALALPLRLESADDSMVDELHARRERTRLLAAFDRSRMESERPPRRSLVVPALAVVLGVVAVLVVGWLVRPEATSQLEARATVRSVGPAVWSRHLEPNVEKVILDSGTLDIEVRPSSEKRRFLVVLPDGELEDVGTTFRVAVEGGRTTEVTVREGSVLLRLRERSTINLGAGQVWANASDVAPSPMPARSAAPASEPDSPPSTSESTSVSPKSPAERPPVVRPRASASAQPSADPSLEFRAATALLGAGDNAGAAAAFAGFLGKYPADPRSEDAAYLRVIALQRAGDSAATERAASDYLRRYPSGFRRAEVEKLAR